MLSVSISDVMPDRAWVNKLSLESTGAMTVSAAKHNFGEYDMEGADQLDIGGGAAAGMGMVGLIVYLAFVGLLLASSWKVYAKAGQPGWACLVPVYNMIVMTKIVGRPSWWVLLYIFTPAAIIIPFDLAKSFGKETGFAIGLLLVPFVCLPMLAFGSATYVGPVAGGSGPSTGGHGHNNLRAA